MMFDESPRQDFEMTVLDYHHTVVDCPSLGLQAVPLRTVERLVQNAWQTRLPIAFVVHRGGGDHLTVVDSVPHGASIGWSVRL
jgi:hypothetical protein